MSEKEEACSDEGNVTLKEVASGSKKKAVSKKKKSEKPSKKDSTPLEVPEESISQEIENDKTKLRKKKYYVEVEENENIAIPLLDQPTVVEGSRQRKKVIPEIKPELLKVGSIPIPYGKGVSLGRIPTVNARFKRLRLDEIKTLHRFMFGKLGDVSHLNSNILSFNGFAFAKDSAEYGRKLVALGKMNMSILREFLLLFDLDLKIRKKGDVIKAILEFLLCPQRSETTANPNIVSHPKRRATKRNYYERDIENEEKKPKKAKQSKTKDSDAAEETGESSGDKSAAKGQQDEKKKDEESKENNSGADNTNELKKPAKKRKRNQVIEEQTESTDDGKSKKSKGKEANNESAMKDEDEVDTTVNLSDDELKDFLKKVLADANLEKTTMKTVYALISKRYPNYNFSKKKDFIKEVVKSTIQT